MMVFRWSSEHVLVGWNAGIGLEIIFSGLCTAVSLEYYRDTIVLWDGVKGKNQGKYF
jgi:hypothetical protein